MAFRTLTRLLIPLLFSASIFAESIQINPDRPDRYVVVKGDTLWDISAKFLEKPWQWPEIWYINPQIEDPHLIYPGDTLTFSMHNGDPSVRLTRPSNPFHSKSSKIKPRIRESSIVPPIRVIPINEIAQFLSFPRVLDQHTLDNSPYVIDFADEHLIVGAGDRVYVRALESVKGTDYTIYRKGETYINPDTKEILGYEAKYVAHASLERSGDPATLKITQSSREIRRGDRLIISADNDIALNYFPRAPTPPIQGNIISVVDGVSQIGQHNIVALDKGTADGIEVGHALTVYQRGRTISDPFSSKADDKVKLPDEKAGVLMVFRTFDRVSYALVLEATQPIHVLDKVNTP
ncbi:MAG: LysM peptidoglycan-binding domain-containing protein [Methylococcales bacterium]|nr:LysM peptidoglycan-binding domain-containing protein [Methylococcales bacterium]